MRRTARTAIVAGLLALATVSAPAAVAANESPCQQRVGTVGTLALPANHWPVGTHTYTVTLSWPPTEPEDTGVWTTDPVTFTVSADAPLRSDPVFFRLFGLSATPGAFTPVSDTINPAQETVFWSSIFLYPGDQPTFKDARHWLQGTAIAFAWDGGADVAANMSPVVNVCSSIVERPDAVHVMGALRRHYAG
jgi:hypothetical protein